MTGPGAPAPLAERSFLAALLALFVHVVFLGLMVFAVSWQTRPLPVVAEIWDALPGPETPSPPRQAPPPKRATESAPVQPPPAVKPPVPELPPKPAPDHKAKAPLATAPKADIALDKEKRRKEAERLDELEARHRRELAEAARRDEERRRETEAARAAAQVAEQARQREQEAAQAAAAEQQRLRDAQAAQQAQAQAQAQPAQEARLKACDAYWLKVSDSIRRNINEAPGVKVGRGAVFKVVQVATSGWIVSQQILESSGDATYDEAVARAIKRSEPLPVAGDKTCAQREFTFSSRPE